MDRYLERIKELEEQLEETTDRRDALLQERENLSHDNDWVKMDCQETRSDISSCEEAKEILEYPKTTLKKHKKMAWKEMLKQVTKLDIVVMITLLLYILGDGIKILAGGSLSEAALVMFGLEVVVEIYFIGTFISTFINKYNMLSRKAKSILKVTTLESVTKELEKQKNRLSSLEQSIALNNEKQEELKEQIDVLNKSIIDLEYFINSLKEERQNQIEAFNKRHFFEETLNMAYESTAHQSGEIGAKLERFKKEKQAIENN